MIEPTQDSKKEKDGWIPIVWAATIGCLVLLIGKVTGVLAIHWIWVFSPIWIITALAFVVFVLGMIFFFFFLRDKF